MKQRLTPANLVLTLIAVVIGLVLAWQLHGPRATPPVGYSPGDPRDRAVSAIEQLEVEQSALKAEISRLRAELTEVQSRASVESDRERHMDDELDAQRVVAGLIAVRGPGVVVTLDDSSIHNIPASSNPNDYLVHEFDVRDVVNVLWLAGAEAIAVNDERIVGNTSVYCVGSTVMVNATRLSPPYIIRAIGEPGVLADTLRNPSYLTSLRQKVERYGIKFQVAQAAKMTLPAYTGGFAVKHCSIQ
jgi:uncharacterized protein YlxW (UPF0749 family)